MADRKIEDCDQRLQDAWKTAVEFWNEKNGLIPSLSCTFRSPQEQDEAYAQGRTKPGLIITAAKSGQSPHNFTPSQAFDFFFQKDGVAIWNDKESYADFRKLILDADPTLVSGASFKFVDADHIETPDWREKFSHQIV
jgi:peptidoglycan L-alanyl-D-glutamate endopeptidase CwlK